MCRLPVLTERSADPAYKANIGIYLITPKCKVIPLFASEFR